MRTVTHINNVTVFKSPEPFGFLECKFPACERSRVLTWINIADGAQVVESGQQVRRPRCRDREAHTLPLREQKGGGLPTWSDTREQSHLRINKSQPLGPCHAFVLLNKVEPESNFDEHSSKLFIKRNYTIALEAGIFTQVFLGSLLWFHRGRQTCQAATSSWLVFCTVVVNIKGTLKEDILTL